MQNDWLKSNGRGGVKCKNKYILQVERDYWGASVASEPLNFLIIQICELLPSLSFLLPFSDCSFRNGHIDHSTDLLYDLLYRYYKYSQICD